MSFVSPSFSDFVVVVIAAVDSVCVCGFSRPPYTPFSSIRFRYTLTFVVILTHTPTTVRWSKVFFAFIFGLQCECFCFFVSRAFISSFSFVHRFFSSSYLSVWSFTDSLTPSLYTIHTIRQIESCNKNAWHLPARRKCCLLFSSVAVFVAFESVCCVYRLL